MQPYLAETTYKIPPDTEETTELPNGQTVIDTTGMVDSINRFQGLFFSVNCIGLHTDSRQCLNVRHICEFGVDLESANQAIGNVKAVDGRFANKRIGQTNFRLLLSKNPSSWRETLETSSKGPKNVLLVVNANTQDGKDTSWLWDVDFKPLTGRNVIVTGDRRIDVSARLTVDGISHLVVDDELAAAASYGATDADLIASYTAFHRLANK